MLHWRFVRRWVDILAALYVLQKAPGPSPDSSIIAMSSNSSSSSVELMNWRKLASDIWCPLEDSSRRTDFSCQYDLSLRALCTKHFNTSPLVSGSLVSTTRYRSHSWSTPNSSKPCSNDSNHPIGFEASNWGRLIKKFTELDGHAMSTLVRQRGLCVWIEYVARRFKYTGETVTWTPLVWPGLLWWLM